jgi:hypothetical protein
MPVILVRLERNLNFIGRFTENFQISSFMKLLLVGAEFSDANGQADRHDEANII